MPDRGSKLFSVVILVMLAPGGMVCVAGFWLDLVSMVPDLDLGLPSGVAALIIGALAAAFYIAVVITRLVLDREPVRRYSSPDHR